MEEITLAPRLTGLEVTPLVKSIANDEVSAFVATRSRPRLTEEARLKTVARFGVLQKRSPQRRWGPTAALEDDHYDSNRPAD